MYMYVHLDTCTCKCLHYKQGSLLRLPTAAPDLIIKIHIQLYLHKTKRCCKLTVKGWTLLVWRGHSIKDRAKGIDYVNSTCVMYSCIWVSACAFTISCLSTWPILISWPRNLLVCSQSLSQDLQKQEAKYRIYYLVMRLGEYHLTNQAA